MNRAIQKATRRHALTFQTRPVELAVPTAPGPAEDVNEATAGTPSAFAVAALLERIPEDSIRALDAWVAEVAACPLTCRLPDQALRSRLEDAAEFAGRWKAMRAALPDFALGSLQNPDGSRVSPEHRLMDLFFQQVDREGLMYREGMVFRLDPPFVSLRGTLEGTLSSLACGATQLKEHFQKNAPSLRRIACLVHDSFQKDARTMRVDSTRLQFANCTALVTAAGIHVVGTPDVVPEHPLVARTFLPAALADVWDESMWDSSAAVPAGLLPFMGALLRPACIRQVDLRPVFLLATCPAEVVHPLVWAMRAFCGFAVTEVLKDDGDTSPPGPWEPYVLYVDATRQPLAIDDIARIRVALCKQMVVVVHAVEVPSQLVQDEADFLRTCCVHVPASSSLLPDVQALATRFLLPAAQAAYSRQPPSAQHLLTFLSDDALVRYRVTAPRARKTAVLLFVEILQAEAGLRLRGSERVAQADAFAVFDRYQLLRYPHDEASVGCTVDDVLAACRLFQAYFGHVRKDREVRHLPTGGEFAGLGLCR